MTHRIRIASSGSRFWFCSSTSSSLIFRIFFFTVRYTFGSLAFFSFTTFSSPFFTFLVTFILKTFCCLKSWSLKALDLGPCLPFPPTVIFSALDDRETERLLRLRSLPSRSSLWSRSLRLSRFSLKYISILDLETRRLTFDHVFASPDLQIDLFFSFLYQ